MSASSCWRTLRTPPPARTAVSVALLLGKVGRSQVSEERDFLADPHDEGSRARAPQLGLDEVLVEGAQVVQLRDRGERRGLALLGLVLELLKVLGVDKGRAERVRLDLVAERRHLRLGQLCIGRKGSERLVEH